MDQIVVSPVISAVVIESIALSTFLRTLRFDRAFRVLANPPIRSRLPRSCEPSDSVAPRISETVQRVSYQCASAAVDHVCISRERPY
jgi:hypothetical protein